MGNKDKLLHFIIGLILGLFSLWLAVVAGIGKEIYDHYCPDTHTCDAWDAAATIAGGVFGHWIIGLV